MKKWLRQVNRGAILLVIVLLAVFVYLIIDAENTSKDKKTLTQISEKYIRDSCTSVRKIWISGAMKRHYFRIFPRFF